MSERNLEMLRGLDLPTITLMFRTVSAACRQYLQCESSVNWRKSSFRQFILLKADKDLLVIEYSSATDITMVTDWT